MGQVKQAQKDQKVPKVKHVAGHSKSLKVDFQFEESFSGFTKNQRHKFGMGNLSSKVWNRKSRIEDQKLPMNCPQNGRCVNSRISWRNTGHFRNGSKQSKFQSGRWITWDFEIHGDFLRNYRSNFLEQPSGSLAVEQLKVKISLTKKFQKI